MANRCNAAHERATLPLGNRRRGILRFWGWLALAVSLGAAPVGGGLYLGMLTFRRRVEYVPVRTHTLLVEARRRRHPPTIPPHTAGKPTSVVTFPRQTPTTLPNAPPTPTSVPQALVTSTASLPSRPRVTPSFTPTLSPSPTPTTVPLPTPLPTRARVTLDLSRTRHADQDWNNCGPATLAILRNQEESHYYLGRARQAQGDLAAARHCYRNALTYHPGFAPALEALASLD
jgi:hypothetical protein